MHADVAIVLKISLTSDKLHYYNISFNSFLFSFSLGF